MPLLAQKKSYLDKWFESDDTFNSVYPIHIQELADLHWTPLKVAMSAAEFLVPADGAKVLDIGSGPGKFCLAASHYKPNGLFYGIEQRKKLIDFSVEAGYNLELNNLTFLHGNFTQLNFSHFDHFYFYNSFQENLDGTEKIDHKILHSLSLYNYYTTYLFNQMAKMPAGTRIVTYHAWETPMPAGYSLVKTQFDTMLEFWIKKL